LNARSTDDGNYLGTAAFTAATGIDDGIAPLTADLNPAGNNYADWITAGGATLLAGNYAGMNDASSNAAGMPVFD
jgi:hypothetical protein